ncbi:hypothetical protein AG1IA_08391 [Rhizoctonia solani AG-1 IA]|uniref:Uncharacterized protein n=1 Tax=Thanatephorus cucumeris (strain AG1-IA) TaxID=983506 RepID=L8WMK1_THACA|nr:hypothetical protein AG1IA_08391 [Rhizoctonia solani AG-1 IA]
MLTILAHIFIPQPIHLSRFRPVRPLDSTGYPIRRISTKYWLPGSRYNKAIIAHVRTVASALTLRHFGMKLNQPYAVRLIDESTGLEWYSPYDCFPNGLTASGYRSSSTHSFGHPLVAFGTPKTSHAGYLRIYTRNREVFKTECLVCRPYQTITLLPLFTITYHAIGVLDSDDTAPCIERSRLFLFMPESETRHGSFKVILNNPLIKMRTQARGEKQFGAVSQGYD